MSLHNKFKYWWLPTISYFREEARSGAGEEALSTESGFHEYKNKVKKS